MRSSASVSVGVALLVSASTAGAFVQAPARCIGTMSQQHQATARTSTSSRRRSSASLQVQGRRSSSPPSYTALFSEGEEGGSPAASAEGSSEHAVGEGGAAAVVEEPPPMSQAEMAQKAKMEEIQRLRAKEKFITAKTGDFECLQCAFVYKPDNAGQGALQGTQFDDLPATWLCPVCKAPKDTFIAQTKTIAGFEDNANYGFGANQMTGSQKNLLIFGSLAAFFVLFLAGYALE